jgi:3-oxoacyl-[acyl-carrier protein] reductase
MLEDKVAVVTGGAIGMGEASVRHFVREGARAVIVDVNVDRANAIVAELPAESALFVETDVANEASVARAVDEAIRAFGRIDILVNAAGITSLVGPVLVEDVELDDWNRMIGINLTGAFLMTKHAVPHMKRQRYGRIVNISSTAALGGGYKGAAPYASSKAGMIGLTREVAREVGGHGITVNAIGPGPTKTPTRKVLADNEAAIAKTVPVGFLAEAEDIANAIVFLSSDAARFITGQLLFVDGGISIPWDIDEIISPAKANA